VRHRHQVDAVVDKRKTSGPMTAGGDSNQPRTRRSRRPSADERALWRLAMRDTEPLEGREIVSEPPPAPVAVHAAVPTVLPPPVTSPAIKAKPAPRPLSLQPLSTRRGAPVPGLDRRTSERLRKGRLPIEARIDLHGMTQDRARSALDHFIASAADRGLRAVLVITGKGSGGGVDHHWSAPRPGILRANVPRWLNEQPNAPRILAFSEAQPQDGGGGALYILLRRQKARA
jgi:DNA-nicking Smr family endonuclease